MALMAYFIRDWRYLHIAVSIPSRTLYKTSVKLVLSKYLGKVVLDLNKSKMIKIITKVDKKSNLIKI